MVLSHAQASGCVSIRLRYRHRLRHCHHHLCRLTLDRFAMSLRQVPQVNTFASQRIASGAWTHPRHRPDTRIIGSCGKRPRVPSGMAACVCGGTTQKSQQTDLRAARMEALLPATGLTVILCIGQCHILRRYRPPRHHPRPRWVTPALGTATAHKESQPVARLTVSIHTSAAEALKSHELRIA